MDLRLAGLQERIGAIAVMMRGRMVHHLDGHTELLRYGRDDSEVIWSVSRGTLNMALLDEAEAAGARIHFSRQLERVDWDTTTLHFDDGRQHRAQRLIGADGAGSALRAAMNAHESLGERFEPLQHGYKELEIPPVQRHVRDGTQRAAHLAARQLHVHRAAEFRRQFHRHAVPAQRRQSELRDHRHRRRRSRRSSRATSPTRCR